MLYLNLNPLQHQNVLLRDHHDHHDHRHDHHRDHHLHDHHHRPHDHRDHRDHHVRDVHILFCYSLYDQLLLLVQMNH